MDDTSFTSGDIAAAATAAPAEASPASAPSTATPPGSGSDKPAGASSSPEEGPVPYARFREVNDERRQYDERLRRVDWAERLDREKVERALQLADRYERDKPGLYRELEPIVRQPTAPEPDLVTEDGRRLYSAEQAAKLVQFQLDQALAEQAQKFDARFGPIEQRDRQAQSAHQLETQISEAAQWPGFMDHLDEITAAVTEANRAGRRVDLKDLYIQIAVPKQIAKLTADDKTRREQERRALLDEMNTTAASGRSEVNPTRTPAARQIPNRDKSFGQLIRESVAEVASKR